MAEITTEELFGKNAGQQVSTEELFGKGETLTSEELFRQKPSFPTQLKTAIKDIPLQLQDLFTIPARLFGTSHPPFVSKLATETAPYLLEKATTPIGTFTLPPLTARNLKSVFTGKGITETAQIEPTPIDIAWYGTIGVLLGKDMIALNRWNAQLNKLIKTEEVRGTVMNNMPAFERLFEQVGIKLPIDYSLKEKTDFVLSQAKTSPKLGSAVMDLVGGKLRPFTGPAPIKTAPIPTPTAPIVTTEELQIPGVVVSESIKPPIMPPALPQVPKAPIIEAPAGIPGIQAVKPKVTIAKVPIAYSEEDKGILKQIIDEVKGAQPGNRYVTRDAEGNVVKAGYEPSDYSLIPYWPHGWGKDIIPFINNALTKGTMTEKQKEKIDFLLQTFKEVKDEQIRLESELASEGISASEINAAKRLGEEEAVGIVETINPENLRKLSTDELEKYIDSRYESGASQDELDLLETIYDERISEDDSKITEEELGIGEATHQGADLEEQLIGMYHRYLNPELRNGMEVKDILSNMRSAIETYGGKTDITDEQILSATKDLYENKQKLLARQRVKEKTFPKTISTEDLFGITKQPPEIAAPIKELLAEQQPISLAPLKTGLEKQEVIPGTEAKFIEPQIKTSEELGIKPIGFKPAWNTPQWIEIWKAHPELQNEMVEYTRQMKEQEGTGTQYGMEPGQAPPQGTFEFYGPEEGKVQRGRPVTGKYTVNDLLTRKDITIEQLMNELKRAVAIHSKDIVGLQGVLQESFTDLLPPRREKAMPQGAAGIGMSGTIANQAWLEMMGYGGDERTLGYRYDPEGEIPLDKWLRNNAFAAVSRTIMRFRVATHNPTDAALVAKYKRVEKMLSSKLVREPTLKQIAIVVKFAKDPKENLLIAMRLKDLIEFAEGKSSFEDSWMQMEEKQLRGGKKVTPPPQYSMSEEEYNSVFNAGLGITEGEILKPKVIPPVTATNETITFPTEGGRNIAGVYEREIGPVLQMSKRMRKWLGVYYGGKGKGSGLIRVKSIQNLRTLAHETGHFLRDVIKYPLDKDTREEILNVSKYARPFDEKYIFGKSAKTGKPTKRQDAYTAYRKSSEELFADYVSVYIAEPDKAKELAPIFTAQVEHEMLKDKEFTWIITKMREFNAAMQPIIDYVKSTEGIIPEINPLIQSWAEKGNVIQNLWREAIGDRIWNLLSGAIDSLGRRTLIGRIFTEKKGLDDKTWEILRQRKHLIDGQTLKIWEELVQPISKMNVKDQEKVNAALQRFDLLASKEEKDILTESARMELAIWGNEARKLGLLNEMAFFNLVGQYFPWMYETKEFDQNKAVLGAWSQKNLRINLQSFKHRLTDEEMGRRALEAKLGTWPSQKAKIAQYSKEELIAIGKKVRTEMKLMKTVAYPLQKRLRMLINSVYTAKALNLVSEIPGIIGHAGMQGYVQLTEGKSLGNLAGQYVPENLAREINSFNYKAEEIESAMEVITSIWKTAKVPYNPAAMMRNAVTNMLQLWMTGDIPTWQPQVMISGINSFIRQDATYKLLRDHGLYRHTYAKEELEKLAFIMETEPETKLETVIKWAATIFEKPSDFYGAVEDCCKTIGAKYILQHGGNSEQAVKLADKCMFDYSSVSQVTGALRKWPLPFFTWSAKEFPRLVEVAIRKPEKMLFILLLLLAGTAYSLHKLGITKKQEESMKPDYLKGNWTLLLPDRDENGQLQWIDFTYFMPWGGWLNPIKGSAVPQPLQIGNPVMALYNAYVQNYDPYAGQIAKDWMTLDEQAQAKRNYVVQSLSPDLSPWGRQFNNIVKAIKKEPNQYGHPSNLGKVLRGALLGIKTVTGGEITTAITNWEAEQKRAQIEVNRPAKLAWEEYYKNSTPENYQNAIVANKKVSIRDRQRIKMKAKKDMRIMKSKNPAWKKLSAPQKRKFRKFQHTLK